MTEQLEQTLKKGTLIGYTVVSRNRSLDEFSPDIEDIVSLDEGRQYVDEQRELPAHRYRVFAVAKVVAMEAEA